MNTNSNNIKGIIFDYGGTLDTGGDHWSEVIWEAWQEAGVAVEKPLFREAYVYGERELARTLHILPHHDFNDLLNIKMNIELQYLAENGHFPPANIEETAKKTASLCYEKAKKSVEKAAVVLKELSKTYPLVLVSNFYGNIETVLKDFGIDSYFQKIIESAVVGVKKPDPKIFLLGAQALKLRPEEILVVGDSYDKDIEPARKAGFKTLWLRGKGWNDDILPADDESVIRNLDDVIGFVEGESA